MEYSSRSCKQESTKTTFKPIASCVWTRTPYAKRVRWFCLDLTCLDMFQREQCRVEQQKTEMHCKNGHPNYCSQYAADVALHTEWLCCKNSEFCCVARHRTFVKRMWKYIFFSLVNTPFILFRQFHCAPLPILKQFQIIPKHIAATDYFILANTSHMTLAVYDAVWATTNTSPHM